MRSALCLAPFTQEYSSSIPEGYWNIQYVFLAWEGNEPHLKHHATKCPWSQCKSAISLLWGLRTESYIKIQSFHLGYLSLVWSQKLRSKCWSTWGNFAPWKPDLGIHAALFNRTVLSHWWSPWDNKDWACLPLCAFIEPWKMKFQW